MSLVINMVTKDEEPRYLESCLSWASVLTDKIFVYDDQSTDDTVEIAKSFDCVTRIRSSDVPSFSESESLCRYHGWVNMLIDLDLKVGDWVLSLDADEFPIGDIEETIVSLERGGWVGSQLKIWEMWEHNPLRHRTDGFWGDISGIRLCKLQRGDQAFKARPMGGGSVPLYALQDPYIGDLPLQLLHLGYAELEDHAKKYAFYSTRTFNGHNNAHIKSIISPPTLEDWRGQEPSIWRGVR